MSNEEINVFERVWKMIWEFLYKIIAYFNGTTIGPDADGTTAVLAVDDVKPIY